MVYHVYLQLKRIFEKTIFAGVFISHIILSRFLLVFLTELENYALLEQFLKTTFGNT